MTAIVVITCFLNLDSHYDISMWTPGVKVLTSENQFSTCVPPTGKIIISLGVWTCAKRKMLTTKTNTRWLVTARKMF